MKSEWQHTSELRQSSLSRARESNRGSKMFTVIKRRKKTQQPSEKMMMENSKKKKRFKYRYWFLCYFYFQSASKSIAAFRAIMRFRLFLRLHHWHISWIIYIFFLFNRRSRSDIAEKRAYYSIWFGRGFQVSFIIAAETCEFHGILELIFLSCANLSVCWRDDREIVCTNNEKNSLSAAKHAYIIHEIQYIYTLYICVSSPHRKSLNGFIGSLLRFTCSLRCW